MTSARLSPAANLLRNSKLFALPPAVPLPPAKPTVDVVFKSDTATTLHPTTAAIYTDSGSLVQGDWGLKRPLPKKPFHKTTTPVIRLRSDIDTQEHIADFDSAADHVLTLQKWQNYPVMMTNGQPRSSRSQSLSNTSVFHPTFDNTTAKPATLKPLNPASFTSGNWNDADRQEFLGKSSEDAETASASSQGNSSLSEILKQFKRDTAADAEASGRPAVEPTTRSPPVREAFKRWRYDGPWIAGMTNNDFELFMRRLDGDKIGAFREHLKKRIMARKQRDHAEAVGQARAAQQEPPQAPSLDITSEEVDSLLRVLREKNEDFAAEIGTFLDLPDSFAFGRADRSWTRPADQQTAASQHHQKLGPPRTHPSAGFSYLRSDRFASISPKYGPQLPQYPLPARHLKQLPYAVRAVEGGDQKNQWGVGGFIVNIGQTGGRGDFNTWRTSEGGPKTSATISNAFVASDGSIQLRANLMNHLRLNAGNVPTHAGDRPQEVVPKGVDQIPQLDDRDAMRIGKGRTTPSMYNNIRTRLPSNSSSADALDDLI
jgi:hypothetical protein